MRQNGITEKHQILNEYDDAISALTSTSETEDVPKTCKMASPVKRGVLLMMRYHRIKIQEDITQGRGYQKFWEMVRIGGTVAFVSALLNPRVWDAITRLLFQ